MPYHLDSQFKKAQLKSPLTVPLIKTNKDSRKYMTHIFFYTMHYTSNKTGCQCFVEKKSSQKENDARGSRKSRIRTSGEN